MPNEDARLDAIEDDLGVQVSRYGLWAMGGLYGLAAVVGGPSLGVSIVASPIADGSTNDVVAATIAIGAILMGLGMGLAHFLAAWGLAGGKRWAWIATLVLAAWSLLQCCAPLSALWLWGMLNNRTRALFAEQPTTL